MTRGGKIYGLLIVVGMVLAILGGELKQARETAREEARDRQQMDILESRGR